MKPAKRTSPRVDESGVTGTPVTDDLPTATALKLWVVLARAFWAVAEVSKADVERHDLTPAEFGILEALYHKGEMLLGDVQKKVLVSSGGITFLVDRLAARGLVERKACPSDRRARYAALTRRGHKVMAGIFPAHAAAIRDAMGGLSRTEQRELTALLRTLGVEAARLAAETPAGKRALADEPR
ncbi:MAG TPA: MarR family transcriptional regulator [Gemmatimonadaceae bacterium]|nr:MarR family transcriptional regulator [Gemmatimonadaceae bacterium]